MKKTVFCLLITLLTLVVIIPACSSPSTEDNTTAFCDSLQELAAAQANVRSIDANTNVDQARQYEEDLQNAWNDVVEAKGDLAVSRYNDLEAAYRELDSSLNSISGDVTVLEALPAIQSAAATFDATLQEIRTTVCNFSPTSTNTP